jgi:glycosyltransferase involved in cell wall biosynthesis
LKKKKLPQETKNRHGISVIMPMFNEEATILEISNRVLKQELVKQLIIVDDCSSDNSWNVAQQLSDSRVLLLRHGENKGKGAAIKTAQPHVSHSITLIQDADLEYDPSQYDELAEPIIAGLADVVYGSRFQTGQMRRVLYFWHYLGNKFLTLLSNAFTNINISDMETCYKVFRSELFKKVTLQESRFGVEPEITAKMAALDARFYEVSISYFGRTYEEGKKIGAKDGLRAIWCILKYNRYYCLRKQKQRDKLN